jgi:tetratricopeptide (TPR) repeat protein
MKKILILAVCFYCSSTLYAQQSTPSKSHYLTMYQRALKLNDSRTAIIALNGYLAIDEDVAYKDTLSILYYLNAEYYSCLLLSKEIYDADKKNIAALERIAASYTQLGDVKTGTDQYEVLSGATKSPYHFYKLAIGQFQLKRNGECRQTIQRIIADTASKRIAVSFTINETENQNVPVLAAAYNMLGVIEMNEKNYDIAKAMFDKALAIYPDFVGALQNKQLLNKPKATKTTAAKPSGRG